MTDNLNKEDIAEQIADNMVSVMTFENMRQFVWDSLYDDLIHQSWSDLRMAAEDYGVEIES